MVCSIVAYCAHFMSKVSCILWECVCDAIHPCIVHSIVANSSVLTWCEQKPRTRAALYFSSRAKVNFLIFPPVFSLSIVILLLLCIWFSLSPMRFSKWNAISFETQINLAPGEISRSFLHLCLRRFHKENLIFLAVAHWQCSRYFIVLHFFKLRRLSGRICTAKIKPLKYSTSLEWTQNEYNAIVY